MHFESFSIGRPQILPLVLLFIPAILFLQARCRKITRAISLSYTEQENSSLMKPLRRALFARSLLRCLAWIFAVLAFSEISWGNKKIPVHKSGSNVTFVFDISYSMLAQDGPNKMTRLAGAKQYASFLLKELSSSSFSAVIAKGDGSVAIPETEDSSLMETMLENLSPHLMTSAGSSIGRGIEAALDAIPRNSAKSQYIWVFTDGDETDKQLGKALEKAVKFDVPVSIIGFGSEQESEITAGDGKTRVKTALRSKKIQEIIEDVEKHNYQFFSSKSTESIRFIDSESTGSAWKLLNQVHNSSNREESQLSYEVQNINHHTLFVFLSLISFVFSFAAGEFSLSGCKKLRSLLAATLIFSAFFSTSCSSEKKRILEGSWEWYGGKYTAATADFLNSVHSSRPDSLARSYAIFDLSATYLSMGELEAAEERLSQLNLDDGQLPAELRSSAFYNRGLIAAKKDDYATAATFFKKAIKANGKNTDAKINLELCERELTERQAKSARAVMQGINEEKAEKSDMKSEIFTVIRENEGKKWRNMSDGGEKENDELDY